VHALAKYESDGIIAAIAGRALYEGTMDFKAAAAAAAGNQDPENR